jgi:hypothetical protein
LGKKSVRVVKHWTGGIEWLEIKLRKFLEMLHLLKIPNEACGQMSLLPSTRLSNSPITSLEVDVYPRDDTSG